MGSATREALAASKAELSALGAVDLATVSELFSVVRVIGESAQLRGILSDTSMESAQKQGALRAVFGTAISEKTLDLLAVAVGYRWSSQADLLDGIEELGLRAAAQSAPASANIESELFEFGTSVSSNAGLELAIGTRQGTDEAKVALVDALLASKVSPQTLEIVQQLVRQPRGRRIGELLRNAAAVVADQSGHSVAVVTAAAPISDAQLARLHKALAASYGRELTINLVIDETLIGGLRVQVGDDVIDDSVQRKLGELRLQLAG